MQLKWLHCWKYGVRKNKKIISPMCDSTNENKKGRRQMYLGQLV